jgi:hypothetical protein
MSTFTIPYPEYDIALSLQKQFQKKNNFSVAVPFSRQQKYYDLILLNGDNRRSVTIQVKSSRTWIKRSEQIEYQYESLLNYFDIKDNYSDFYFVYMTYPLLNENSGPGAKWDRKILVFNDTEMGDLLGNVKTKSGKQDRFFSFGFNALNDVIYGARGLKHLNKKDYSVNLLDNKLDEIRRKLG